MPGSGDRCGDVEVCVALEEGSRLELLTRDHCD